MPFAKIIGAIVLIVLVLAGAGYYWYAQQRQIHETLTVSTHTVTENIEFKGHVEAEEIVKLGFERSGIVAQMNVAVGDSVKEGTPLAALDTRATELDVAQAFAQRADQRDQARIAMEKAQATADNTATENKRQLELKRQAVRDANAELEHAKKIWKQTSEESGNDSLKTKTAYADVLTAQTAYNTSREDLRHVMESVEKSDQAAADSYRVAQAAYQAVIQASGSVAGLSALEAGEQKARVQLAKDTLVSPISGTVTATAIKASEVALAGESVITIQTTNRKEITADVDEIDIPKVTLGATAAVTFDAYPGEDWLATVISIDPAGTIEDEDDVTYKVTLRLHQDEERLLPALTARVKITTSERINVIAIPRLALEQSGRQSYVYVAHGPTPARRLVTLGLAGTDGVVEITSGLSVGEQILRRPPE